MGLRIESGEALARQVRRRSHKGDALPLLGQPVWALVPARAGSKGIHRKNVARLLDRPLVSYTLEAALAARGIDASYLSSDDPDILRLGSELGVRPILRPAQASSDEASAVLVVKHFLSVVERNGIDPYIVYLQPTSPLRCAVHIEEAIAVMARSAATSLLSVVRMAKSPFKAFQLDGRGRLQSLFDERLSNARRQDLPPTYLANGAIYIFKASEFEGRRGFPSNGSLPYVMDEDDSIDIDSEADIRRAEALISRRRTHDHA